jgi:very-short-patch-repair endonuclease
MILKELKPRKALNKAFLKVKPNRTEIEGFKTNLITLLDRTNDTESEEFHKNLVSDFLKKTYYDPNHFINTKGRNDLVIHNGQNANSTVGVILEAKKPTNKSEMITTKKLNAKAFQELVLYYLRERITHKNLEVKHVVATNINEWFIFDEHLFERLFAQNKSFVRQFENFEASKKTTDVFYKEIAEPFIDSITSEIEFTYFNIQDFQIALRNTDQADDNSLIALFKLLSPEHLLKLPFTNDSNSLDKRFYSELLHIIGLTETKEGSKKVIERNKAGERHTGTILEDAIIQLDSLDKLSRLEKPNQFGNTQQERLFSVALELSITWINRILFLKLLEAQLITYHKGDKSYSFLNLDKIKNYDDLNSLFFQVLARKYDDRNEDVQQLFEKVPYLNSSLFEPTDMEQVALFISNLKDDKTIPIFSQTVLKDSQGKKRTGNLSTLQYLFEFLDAYDFGAEGGSAIQEDNKTLINASVLGLIFEKINGYKDGSFFTPGFITMYMCRETIRKAVVQKFNEHCLNHDLQDFKINRIEDIYELIPQKISRKKANEILNSLKICDPAVGSGHFLVSALNEMIAVKNDLKILEDREGKSLHRYEIEVVNDELIVTDEEGELFEYKPSNKESQRIQETLFHEKQTIIENCLFGVDINSNSVKICRLRLWIELLKNAYYIQSSSPNLGEVSEGQRGLISNSNQVSEGRRGLISNSNQVSEGRRGQEQFNNLPHLKTFRKNLRNNLTPAEAKLWTLLKGKQMEGRKFRRQHSFANYILDFYCPEERLAIELDGQGHFEATQAEYDRERDLFLKTFGIRVLRFENKWVWDNPEGLLEIVRGYFGKQPPRPADTPPYKGGELRELQTLPNIDINIKCGNSLVSRFAIDADLKQALKKSKWTIDSYRIAVDTYRNAESKEQKREMERLIADIKSDFRSEISLNDPKIKKLRKLSGELFQMTNQGQLFEMSKKEKVDWNKKVTQLTEETKKLEAEIEEIKANKIFENAFEWRFEFPEVLNDDGDFVGFDVVIGNPPYVNFRDIKNTSEKNYFLSQFKVSEYQSDLFILFVELAFSILRRKGEFAFIIPNSITNNLNNSKVRKFILDNARLNSIINTPIGVFPDATVDTVVLIATLENTIESVITVLQTNYSEVYPTNKVRQSDFLNNENYYFDFLTSSEIRNILSKIEIGTIALDKISDSSSGIKEYETGKGKPPQTENDRVEKVFNAKTIIDKTYRKHIQGNDVSNYALNWQGGYLKYGEWLAAPRDAKYFEGERIIIREIPSKTRLIASFTDEDYTVKNTAHIFMINKDYETKYVVALLNSLLFGYYFVNKFSERDDVFPKAKIGQCRLLPIKICNNNQQKEFVDLVDKILLKKQEGKDTKSEENQIDQLVYQLYELTEEEIAIVEGSSK